jgi:HK97 family phage prohead protease
VSDVLYRPAEGLELRSAAAGGDGRTVVGIAVPYGVPKRIDDQLVEQFARGAFADQLEHAHRAAAPGGRPSYRVHFAREHVQQGGTVIGKAVEIREDGGGLFTALRVSKTPAGEEALALIEDGVLDELSVGFRTRPAWSRRLPDGTIERTRAELFEVSIVLRGAYDRDAVVSGVRAAEDAAEIAARSAADIDVLGLLLVGAS